MAEVSDFDRTFYTLPVDSPVCRLECGAAFSGLTAKERLYAHHLSRAGVQGALICPLQISLESPVVFALLRRLFAAQSVDSLKAAATDECGLSDEEWASLLVYSAGVFANFGTYKSFGDSKFVPALPQEKFVQVVKASAAYGADAAAVDELLGLCADRVFSLTPRERSLALAPTGVTTYHSANVTAADAALVDRWLSARKIEPWNSRLFKVADADRRVHFEIRLASVLGGEVRAAEEFEGCWLRVTRGDYSEILRRVVDSLQEAKKYAANENQEGMLDKYVEHFTTGELDAHKDASRCWIKDKAPAVESYIGFIENYRDPVGSRSEFEGFVAAVNRESSAKFARLVADAENILVLLPWGADYEKDKFLRPDFTALDVIAFGSAGVPAGINIPNYEEIRQNEGFKNVSLNNVIAALPKQKINFLTDDDEAIFKRLHKEAFEVQVGLHELLGHGSGKMFKRLSDGSFNFDMTIMKDCLTGAKISKWYEKGDTWSSKFGGLSNAYEECRAEAVGYFLSCFAHILKIFGYEGEVAEDVKYVNWLSEVRAGLVSLEFYSPEKSAWGQAHCHARYVLLRVVLAAGGGFVQIDERTGDDGRADLLFKLDRDKIDSVGKRAVADLLKKLQHYKSTGDYEGGKALFDSYGVDEQSLRWRETVVARRQPRRLTVQAVTRLDGDDATVVQYPETHAGIIQSVLDSFADDSLVADMMDAWRRDRHHFEI